MTAEQSPTRAEIADLLAQAAELEHALLCTYLFAAFSVKQKVDEGGVSYLQLNKTRNWKATLLKIARQEMEHLGLVSNVLSAIGEAPTMRRRNFPVSADALPIAVPLELKPFSLELLKLLILYELPSKLDAQAEAFLKSNIPEYTRYSEYTIEKLYDRIHRMIKRAGDTYQLFIGPKAAQINNLQIFPARIIGVPVAAIATRAYYDVIVRPVYNTQEALAVIDQIRHEGEGWAAKGNYGGSHFGELMGVYQELQAELKADPKFIPARPVVDNPRAKSAEPKSKLLMGSIGEGQPTGLTNPLANRVATLFDRGYQITVLMLMRFFFHNGENSREIVTLARTVFFPMMTTFIRPLGELLTQLRAFADPADERRAGPGFALAPRLAVIPDPHAAWQILVDELENLRQGIQAIAETTERELTDFDKSRLTLMWQNLARIGMDYRSLVDPPEKIFQPQPPGPPPPPVSAKPQPRLVLEYAGRVLVRLPTDPDPTDERRGVSGTTFALGDEPDLTRTISFEVPKGLKLRSYSPEIGVYVTRARRHDDEGAHDIVALEGARFSLLDAPRLENRNWTLTLPGCEPIVPFHMQIAGSDGVVLDAADELAPNPDPKAPPLPIWQASSTQLQRRGPPGFALEPQTVGKATGEWDSLRIVRDRYARLKRDLENFDRKNGDQAQLAILEARLAQLEIGLTNPLDRRVTSRYLIERWGFTFNQDATVEDPKGKLGGALVTAGNSWQICFWLGAWDPDVLCAYLEGSLTIPYVS